MKNITADELADCCKGGYVAILCKYLSESAKFDARQFEVVNIWPKTKESKFRDDPYSNGKGTVVKVGDLGSPKEIERCLVIQ